MVRGCPVVLCSKHLHVERAREKSAPYLPHAHCCTHTLPSTTDALNNSFTVFAPTDSTFLKTLTTLNIDPAVLTSPAVLPTLASILTYHVVPNAVPLEVCCYCAATVLRAHPPPSGIHTHHPHAQLIKSQPVTTVTTVAGTPLTINFDASATPGVTVTAAESTAKVLDPQVPGEPGIAVSTECFIHVFPIDAILLPAGATAILGTLSGVKP